MNIDGTGFRALDEDTVLDYEVHPHDRRIVAYIAIGRGRNLELRLLWLPERNSMTITPLGGRSVVYEAIEGDGLAWSPDGTKIAFVGALDDSTVDVYAFDVPSGDITRVADLENYGQIYVGEDDYETESPRHASRLRWSPDGRYILFGDFTDNLGWPFSAVWAASVDGNRQMLLMDIGSEGWVVNTVGWFDPATILLLQTTGKGLPVVSINLDTGSASHILDEEIQCAAYSPRHKTWLIGLNNQQNETGEEEILQLIKPDGTRITIPDLNWSYYTWWRENDDAFLVLGGDEDYLITVNGDVSLQNPTTLPDTFAGFPQVDEYSSPNLLVSPDGSLWAWGAYPRSLISGLWVGEPYTEPAQIHFENDITEDPWDSGPNLVINRHFWTPDSQNIVLLTNNGVYLATRPEFELVKIASGVFHLDPSIYYSDETAMWLP